MNMLGDDQLSDYFGSATLESWLVEEVFDTNIQIPLSVVALFERWRQPIESNIESWMMSDCGDGSRVSWRAWGRGFQAIPDGESDEFDAAEIIGWKILGR